MHAEERIKERITSDDPVGSLEELFSDLPRVKMLAGTIEDIVARAELIGMTEDDQTVLTRAKDARNFIAHDAKDIGTLDFVRREQVAEFIGKLRAAVADVAAGDNFISRIVYRIEERREPIPYIVVNYVDLIDLWVLGTLSTIAGSQPYGAFSTTGGCRMFLLLLDGTFVSRVRLPGYLRHFAALTGSCASKRFL